MALRRARSHDNRLDGRYWRNDIEGLGTLFSNPIPDYRNLITRYTTLTASKQGCRTGPERSGPVCVVGRQPLPIYLARRCATPPTQRLRLGEEANACLIHPLLKGA